MKWDKSREIAKRATKTYPKMGSQGELIRVKLLIKHLVESLQIAAYAAKMSMMTVS
jgi:hypothetical protein